MPQHPESCRSARLGVEVLETREVPASFGPTRGMSIAGGTIFQNLPNTAGPNQYVMGTGPGVPAMVRAFDDQGNLLQSFRPFGINFRGGVTVAVGDVNADGRDDVICGTGPGTVGRVKVYTYENGGLKPLLTFVAFGPTFNGGVNVAAGPVLGGSSDPDVLRPDQIVVSVASNGPPRVKVFGVATGVPIPYRNFLAYNPNYTAGVNIAVANIDTDADILDATGQLVSPVASYSEIITGKARERPHVKIFDVQTPTVVTKGAFMAFDPIRERARRGVTLTAGDTIGERGAQIYVNLIGTDTVRVFDGESSAILTTFDAYPNSGGFPVRTQMLSMAIVDMTNGNPDDDQFSGTYFTHDLVLVAADGPVLQVPYIVFGGALPAGFNGGGFAP